jgi:DNA-binding MarR family transcriptional regulator
MNNHIKETTQIETTVLKLKSAIFRKFTDESRHHSARQHNFSASTPLLINILAEHYATNQGPITTTELADKMNLSIGAISRTLDPLEAHHLIRRQKSPQDKRPTFITLTTRGKFMLRRINNHQNHTQIIDELLDYLGEKDSAEFVRLCKRIDDFIEAKENPEPQATSENQ